MNHNAQLQVPQDLIVCMTVLFGWKQAQTFGCRDCKFQTPGGGATLSIGGLEKEFTEKTECREDTSVRQELGFHVCEAAQ